MDEKIRSANDLLKEGHPIGDVWRQFGFRNAHHFRYHFRKLLGFTPGAHLPDPKDRVKEGERLLLEGGRTVTDVARQVGYDGYQGFYNAFYKVHGMSPKQWLSRRHKGG